ncbi:uncharacterized protein LOC111047498 [Nilaparvata lugens]|uniref:uncharacterized protein LOC111047498 n=1 Tax=Nilaparvata lugens TaxID=108931 RepID=UPI00193EB8EB|nr:uncharacterized protein LOC111047498 [Nilaparvata lugens]
MMSMRKRTQVMEEFIKLYESLPCLWQVKNKEYRKKHLREAAYNKLLEKLREIEPDSDRDYVVRKINSFRSCFRRELQKRNSSIRSGASGDDIYKPKLWYFDLFYFLEEYNSTNDSFDDIELTENWNEDSLQEETLSEESFSMHPSPVSRTQSECEVPLSSYRPTAKRLRTDVPTSKLYIVCDHAQKSSSQVEDRYDLLGKSIACRIRALDKRERQIVEKNINDILYEAEMKVLDAPTHQYNFDCTIKVDSHI